MASKFTIDGDAIRQLADILVDSQLTEIEYEVEGRRIRVSRGGTVQMSTVVAGGAAPMETPRPELALPVTVTSPAGDHPGTIKSPMVGTAYMRPEPGAAPFVKVGDTVNVGQTLMIIEAMKVMNPIKATRVGKVASIFVQDTTPVEYGEPLMVIE